PRWSQKSWVFVSRVFRGEAVASDELEPLWVDVADIPLDRMWDDARFWLPAVLAGGSVAATFSFAADGRTVETSDHHAFPGAAP
ncbi:MAG: hypothetical protein JWQ43_2840, partial [Glaciihabitans sp.]|nr:hypothetical protein [Glaciihabitans sp.]